MSLFDTSLHSFYYITAPYGGSVLDKAVRELIEKRIKDLPTLPVIATRILEVTEDPESSVDDLKKIILMDQVVSARLLKAVNSAYFGFPRKIDTLSQAIVILGFNNVRSLALSVSILNAFTGEKKGSGFNHRSLWQHAVGVAFMAQALGRTLGWRKTEHFFMAGLLHDIGLVPMDQAMPGQFRETVKLSKKNNTSIYLAEKELLGFTHADVGSYIAEKWLLPETLREPIAHHHAPPGEPENPEITLAVHAADILCKARGFGGYGDNEAAGIEAISADAMNLFNIEEDFPEAIQEFLDENLENARDFFSIFV